MTTQIKNSFSKGLCLLIEDQEEVADSLRKSVSTAFPGIKLFIANSLRDAKEWLNTYKSGEENLPLTLCLVDLGLPDGSGIQIIRKIAAVEPNAKTVVITIYDDDAYLFEALSAGASGYVLKEEEPDFLIDILKRLENDEPPLSPAIARRLLEHFHKTNTKNESTAELTPRERETLTLLARGHTVPEAAKRMGLSAQTVAGYAKIVYQKLHVSNRAEATREAIKRGLV